MSNNDFSDIRKARAIQYLQTVWTPHSGQVTAGQAIFQQGAKHIYIESGRKFGKSEFSVFVCWMHAIMHPNSEVYYQAPAVKLARELVWANQRMQTCNSYDREFIKKLGKILGGEIEIYRQEMRIVLPNGSFIKVDGSDNIDSQLGLKPDLIIADEFRTFKTEWLEFMVPNLAAKNGRLVCISTPSLGPNRAYEHAQECKKGMEKGNPKYFYLNLPSETNDAVPHLKQWLKEEKARLIALGREAEWRREYMAEFITCSDNAVIPQMNRKAPTLLPTDEIKGKLKKRGHFELFVTLFPGNSTIFGALGTLLDRSTGEIYIFDEYKEYNSEKTATGAIWPLIEKAFCSSLEALGQDAFVVGGKLDDFTLLAHHKAPWLRRDMHEAFDIAVEMTDKDIDKPEYNLSLIKDLLLAKKCYIDNKCSELIKEAETYLRNEKTYQIPDSSNKLLINGLRAALCSMGYTSDLIDIEDDLPDDERLLERIINKPSFEARMRELRLNKYGILCDDEDNLFFEDFGDNYL